MADVSLTAVVLTFNEAAHIENCLRHLSWVDEILVVDSGSNDETLELCRTWPKTRVMERHFDDFASQRNAGVEAARGTWILTVDADEEIPASLAKEIQQALKTGLDIYRIPRLNVIFGKPLRYGMCLGDVGPRLFRRRAARYRGGIHESLVFEGKVGHLRNPMVHHSYENVSDWVDKMDRYTSLEAERLLAEGRCFRWVTLLLGPWASFARYAILRRGWRDGWPGLLYTLLGSFYLFVKHLKFKERLDRGAGEGGLDSRGTHP
jgi:glycosyltransferase involved in cell wall biosynthesis